MKKSASTPVSTATPLLFAAVALTGCLKTTLTVPVMEAARLESGTVYTADGHAESTGDDYTVALVPFRGTVFVQPDPTKPHVFRYPKDEIGQAPGRELRRAPPLIGPVRGFFDHGYLTLTSSQGELVVQAGQVESLQIRKPSPGKTAALWIGSGIGAALIGTVIAGFLSFNGSFGNGR